MTSTTRTIRNRSKLIIGAGAVAVATLLLGGIAPAQAQQEASVGSDVTATMFNNGYNIMNESGETLVYRPSDGRWGASKPTNVEPGQNMYFEVKSRYLRADDTTLTFTTQGGTVTVHANMDIDGMVPDKSSCTATIGECTLTHASSGLTDQTTFTYKR